MAFFVQCMSLVLIVLAVGVGVTAVAFGSVHTVFGQEATPSADQDTLSIPVPPLEMQTGTATSLSESVSLVNVTTTPDSTLSVTTTVIASESGDFAPFTTAPTDSRMETTPSALATSSAIPDIDLDQQVVATTTADAITTTGNNTLTSSHSAKLESGDALSIASATTIANTTLIHATLQVATIAITDNWSGNLILYPDETYQEGGMYILSLDQTGNILTTAEARAESGNNESLAEMGAQTTTGSTLALASAASIVNLALVRADLLTILTENPSLWYGQIRNLYYPGSLTAPNPTLSSLQATSEATATALPATLRVDNQSAITTLAVAEASTGDNIVLASESASLATGDAVALASATTVANTTLIDARYRLLHLMVAAPWYGDLIVAYPDLTPILIVPTVSEARTNIPYTLIVANRGYVESGPATVTLTATDSDGRETTLNLPLESIPSQTQASWQLTLDPKLAIPDSLMLTATVVSAHTEESLANNVATQTIHIIASLHSDQLTESALVTQPTELPHLTVQAQHNVGSHIFPGDTFVYDIDVTNDGPVTATQTNLVQRLYSPDGTLVSTLSGDIGVLSLNETRHVRIALHLSTAGGAGRYTTETLAQSRGEAPDSWHDSPVATNSFLLKFKDIFTQAVSKSTEGAVLSATDTMWTVDTHPTRMTCTHCPSFPWYIGVAAGSVVYYFLNRYTREVWRTIVRHGLLLPAVGYGGLLYTSGDCRQGLMLRSLSVWCTLFLPLAVGGYLLLMSGARWIQKSLAVKRGT